MTVQRIRFVEASDVGSDPDNMRYDEGSKRVYVGFGQEDGGIGMIDPKTDERVGDVYKTGGHPESFQVEATAGHIFVNVPDARKAASPLRTLSDMHRDLLRFFGCDFEPRNEY